MRAKARLTGVGIPKSTPVQPFAHPSQGVGPRVLLVTTPLSRQNGGRAVVPTTPPANQTILFVCQSVVGRRNVNTVQNQNF